MKTNNKRQPNVSREIIQIFTLHFDAHFNFSQFAKKILKSEVLARSLHCQWWMKVKDLFSIIFGVRD